MKASELRIGGILCSVEYIHQLQNLYFALTGEELKCDLSDGEYPVNIEKL